MGGLIKDFALTALIIILNHWVYGIEDSISYEFIVSFFARKQTLFLSIGIFGSVALVFSASMFESLGFYRITYGLSKITVRLSQFVITFIAILNIVFYSAMGSNLMRDNGYLVLFAFALLLGASCWAIRITDFNYHTQNAILPVGLLALMSIILVEYVWPLSNF